MKMTDKPLAGTRSSLSRATSETGWRLAKYLRPYLILLLVSILCALSYAGARAGRAYLAKPLLDDVVLQNQDDTNTSSSLSWVRDLLPTKKLESGKKPSEETFDRGMFGEQAKENFLDVVVAALLAVLIIPLSHFGQSYVSQYILGRVLVDLQQNLCQRLLNLPLAFHQSMTRGERLSRTTNDATRAHVALELLCGDVLQGAFSILVGGAILLSISWQLSLLILITVPIVTGVIAYFGTRVRRYAKRRQESFGVITQRLVEILSNIKVIKSFGAQTTEASSFRAHNEKLFRRSMKVVLTRALSRTVVEGVNNFVGVGVLVIGAIIVYRGWWALTPGSLAAFVMVMGSVYKPVKDLTKGWNGLMDSLPAAERFFELLDQEPETPDPADAQDFSLEKELIVSNLFFTYRDENSEDTSVLQGVTFSASAGSLVAIVGKTGAGKTTLVDLLVRFYDPESGNITVDGMDLRKIKRRSLTQNIAVVSQEPLLFEGSIRDNIKYGNPLADDFAIEKAAKAAYVTEFSSRLKNGLDTLVGEEGERLSGGQRQRITIARALLKDPALLVLDEATSALDSESESYVQNALEELIAGRTVFVIAHRLSTIRHATKIIVLEQGRIVDSGTHIELSRRAGLYRELLSLQTGIPEVVED
ncbi:ABC transporter ATP-binding protein/permease [Myxococcota bacterium]|nr:ABC transporter ATP-binding protein/permease [Myxococcota bacterium]